MKTKKEKLAKTKGICPKCNGNGTITKHVMGGLDVHIVRDKCDLCKGLGKLY